jgi:peptidyl-prolyl cis-trans isomerase SurA
VDSGASPKQTRPIYSAYTPPAPKKKAKVERTRFRESTRTFRQKSAAAVPADTAAATPAPAKQNASAKAQKPGKKEKIRLGRAPTKTLPKGAETKTEDAGAVDQTASAAQEPVNPLESNAKPVEKTRYSARAKVAKAAKVKTKGKRNDKLAPTAPDSAEVADRQTQAGPLGLAGDTASKKKKKSTTTAEKKRLADKKKTETKPQGDQPLGPAPAPNAPSPAAPPAAPAPPAPQPQK